MFTFIACLLLKTLESIATPCSVKTIGRYLTPPQLEVTNCDLKLANSSLVNSNIKSSGNLSMFLLPVVSKPWYQLHKVQPSRCLTSLLNPV